MSVKVNMKLLFEPDSIAVIGASHHPEKIGNILVRNLVSGGFQGAIIPVNPSGGEMHGLKVYPDLNAIGGEVTAAAITLPARQVIAAVEACAAKKIKFIQILASGFSETGNTAGEASIARIARENGMRILGPNVFGLFSSTASMNATFSSTDITPGHVAIVTQSGALGIALIGKAVVDRMGLSAIVSTGNKCDIDESDLLEYLVEDENTRSILMYIEGVKDGVRLVDTLKKAVKRKPVVVLKSGSSLRGALAAAAHTGSLAGSDEIFDAIMKQCGVIRAHTLEQAVAWSQFLAQAPHRPNLRSVIITNGGGIGVLAADTAEEYGVDLYDDQKDLRNTFEKAAPDYGSLKNPIDITAVATSRDYRLAADALLANPLIDSAVFLYCQTVFFDAQNLAPMVRELYRDFTAAGKPVIFALFGGVAVHEALAALKRENLPVHEFVEDAVSSLGALAAYNAILEKKPDEMVQVVLDRDKIARQVGAVVAAGRTFLLADECHGVLEAAGIPVIDSVVCRNLTEVMAGAEMLSFPLVMKVMSKDIHQKSDVGGIALDLTSKNDLLDAFEAIKHNVKTVRSDAVIDGVMLSPMVYRGLEINIVARRDQAFGPVVSCSLGGIFAEVNPRVSHRFYPLTRDDVRGLLEETGAYPLLLGVRWEMRKDIEALVDLVLKTGEILALCEQISSIEIDPVSVYEKGKGVLVLDSRVTLNNPKEETL